MIYHLEICRLLSTKTATQIMANEEPTKIVPDMHGWEKRLWNHE